MQRHLTICALTDACGAVGAILVKGAYTDIAVRQDNDPPQRRKVAICTVNHDSKHLNRTSKISIIWPHT